MDILLESLIEEWQGLVRLFPKLLAALVVFVDRWSISKISEAIFEVGSRIERLTRAHKYSYTS
ncbi:MAG: hypothetical protein ABIE07_09115 [Candidatus Zixiibacteriota bacterium]